ncbi:hypothetical protein [Silvibacterium dinghuense]|uniref:hypothetical protein n=1 Tax=Silvibacterium dinghuense TaxID=1560006 RepID=UPI00166A6704|nr:hypothetical protein [Silvibacterium dinghuense]GGG98203.1 hypothetical protein GCM10011586_11960 [Silvibacterium dinghuense]
MVDVVFLLWYVRLWDEGEDTELLVGVYSSEANARAAIERLKGQPGFRQYVQGFQVHPYSLDRDSWTEGYARMDGDRNLVDDPISPLNSD